MSSSILAFEPMPHPADAVQQACLFCDGATRPWLALPGDWRKPSLRRPFELRWCERCDFGFLSNRPAPEALADHYRLDAYYTHLDPQALGRSQGLFDRLRVRAAWSVDHGLRKELDGDAIAARGIATGGRVCDVGCGNGGLMVRLAKAGYVVTGIEPDENARRVVAESGLRVVAGSAEHLPVATAAERFDAVTMMHVLEHCLDPASAVRNVAGLLADGGLLFVETPNNACEGVRLARETWRWLDVPRHVNFFTTHSLQAVCRSAGLEIVDVEYTGYTRQFQAEWIAEEQEIRRRLIELEPAIDAVLPIVGRAQAVGLLWKSWNLPAARKYDSVRVIARKPRANA